MKKLIFLFLIAAVALGQTRYAPIKKYVAPPVVSNAPLVFTYYPTWCYGATANDLKINPNSGVPWSRLDVIIHFAATYEPSTAPYFGPVSNPQPDSLNLQYNLPNLGAGAYGNFQDTLIRTAHSKGKKVLICWGVIGNGVQIFGDSVKVQQAVNCIAAYCQRKGYDGSDIDWEYPDGGTNHARYARMMRRAFDALNDGKHYLVTTSSVNANTPYNTSNCPVYMDAYVDYYLPQMYSLWSVWSQMAGSNVYTYNSPLVLNSSNQCSGQDGPYCWANTGPGALASQGHAKSKIIGGFPGYGYVKPGTTLRCSAGVPDQGVNYRLREMEGFLTRGGVKTWDALAGQNWVSGTLTGSGSYLGVSVGQQFALSYCDSQAARAHAQWIVAQGIAGIFTWDLEEGCTTPNGPGTDANHPLEATIWKVFHGQ
jgi:hypothetical protein